MDHLKVMYLVVEVDYDYTEIYGVFDSSEAAYDFVRFEETEAKRKHQKVPCLDVDEVFLNPPNLAAARAEENRLWAENVGAHAIG